MLGSSRVRHGLGSIPKCELGQHVADVVGRGFTADEQAFGDLRIREPEAHKGKDLLLSLRENADVPGARSA